MSMSKKDFIALADVLKATKPPSMSEDGIGMNTRMQREARGNQWREMRDALADFCQKQNANFLRDRWRGYIDGLCGPNGGEVRRG
jgi:hypothetical protein